MCCNQSLKVTGCPDWTVIWTNNSKVGFKAKRTIRLSAYHDSLLLWLTSSQHQGTTTTIKYGHRRINHLAGCNIHNYRPIHSQVNQSQHCWITFDTVKWWAENDVHAGWPRQLWSLKDVHIHWLLDSADLVQQSPKADFFSIAITSFRWMFNWQIWLKSPTFWVSYLGIKNLSSRSAAIFCRLLWSQYEKRISQWGHIRNKKNLTAPQGYNRQIIMSSKSSMACRLSREQLDTKGKQRQ